MSHESVLLLGGINWGEVAYLLFAVAAALAAIAGGVLVFNIWQELNDQ